MELDTHLRLDDSIHEAVNLTSRFSPEDLTRLGNHVVDGYLADEVSREAWLRRTSAAMDLAMQVVKAKTFPWPNAANVAFPLVTIAALQFHSRAYPALIDGREVVKQRVPGFDSTGVLKVQADRVGRFMSWQVLEEDSDWEELHDRLFLSYSIVGCEFVKTYHSNGRNDSERVAARDLAMNYFSKSVEESPRKTQILRIFRNDIHEKCLRGLWRDITREAWYEQPYQPPESLRQPEVDKRTGLLLPVIPDDATPITFLEQHCWLDLDQDGYAEPYIVTVEQSQRFIVRIVARWDRKEDVERTPGGRVIRICATEYYTKYGFIPSPDGSVYDVGWGLLLGPLNESVSTLINQLLDTGTFQLAAGGFFARGVKMRGGATTFQPFGWQHVDSTGDDLRKGILPFPKDFSAAPVLFQLLTLLVTYAQRISASTDMMAGENPGQNTPAETSRTMVEQGMKIYTALFKRAWRCMKEEFRKLYILNGQHMPEKQQFGAEGETIGREDFLHDSTQICPAADPNIVSDAMRIQQAITLSERARMIPGYSIPEVERNFLRSLRVDAMDALYPGPDKVPPLPNPKMQVEQTKLQGKQMDIQAKTQMFVADLMEQRRMNSAKILELSAKAAKEYAEAGGVDAGHKIAMIEAEIGMRRQMDESFHKHIEHMQKQTELGIAQQEADTAEKAANRAPAEQG